MSLSGSISTGGVDISDETVVANSLSITMSTCPQGRFTFGTFNSSILKITIRDEEAAANNYANGHITLSKDGTSLGVYWIDDSKTRRNRNLVTLTALDDAVLFDKQISTAHKNTEFTPIEAINAACTACACTPAVSSLGGFPNSGITFKPASAAVQTYRDLVMWTVQLLGANAVINRNGWLDVRSARYGYDSSADFECTASDRSSISVSDSRTWIKYLSAYSSNTPKTYVSPISQSDADAVPGALALPKNPLLESKTEAQCDAIYMELLNDIDAFMQREINAKMFDDPSVQLGAQGRFSGGKVDRRGSILGVVTGITWRYRGIMSVICTAPASAKEDS